MGKLGMLLAREKPFTLPYDSTCWLSGWVRGEWITHLYHPIPLKKGDTFRLSKSGKLLLNGSAVHRSARPPKRIVYQISWVAKRLRVAVFRDRDRIWSHRLKRYLRNKFSEPYWTACDLRSYHIGCADTIVDAVKGMIEMAQFNNRAAEEERSKGNPVRRWRCVLKPKEVREMEAMARKTGFILDGVEVPSFPRRSLSWIEKQKALISVRRR